MPTLRELCTTAPFIISELLTKPALEHLGAEWTLQRGPLIKLRAAVVATRTLCIESSHSLTGRMLNAESCPAGVFGAHLDELMESTLFIVQTGYKVFHVAAPTVDNILSFIRNREQPMRNYADVRTVVLSPGDAVLLPAGAVHVVANLSPESVAICWSWRHAASELPILAGLDAALLNDETRETATAATFCLFPSEGGKSAKLAKAALAAQAAMLTAAGSHARDRRHNPRAGQT